MAVWTREITSAAKKLAAITGVALWGVSLSAQAATPSAPQIKQASVNGVTLDYQDQGEGAPVVFIHGCCTDYRAWDKQREALAPHYHFIGLNMRYFGSAPWPDNGAKYSQQTDVDDIVAFLQGLNVGPVDLVGWSYSGPIVMLVALQHPELVHSLVVHEPGGPSIIPDPVQAKLASDDRGAMLTPVIAAAKSGDLELAARLTPGAVNNQPDAWETLSPNIQTMFRDNARTWTAALTAPPQPPLTCDMLHQMKMPTLITRGADTRATFALTSDAAAHCIPSAQYVIVPGRHLAIAQQPVAFNAALLQFLENSGSKPGP